MSEFVVHSRKGRTTDRLDSSVPTEKMARDLDYQTPEKVLACVRTYFDGPIPLDPATALNNPTQATRFCALAPDDLALTTAWFKANRSPGLTDYLASQPGPFVLKEKIKGEDVQVTIVEHNYVWRHFDNDGLRVEWDDLSPHGAFVNPPYGGVLRAWLDKIVFEASKGLPILALIPASRFEQGYFHDFLAASNAVCYVRSRVAFIRPTTGEVAKGNPYSSIVFGFNVDRQRFHRSFGDLGLVMYTSAPEEAF